MANQGIYHPTYNPNGSKKLSDNNFWYNTTISITSTMDCFDSSKMLTASGYIGTVSARPDGLFYDQVHEGDILDLRNSSKKVEDYNRLINREFNKLVAGTYRGKEGEYELKPFASQDTDGTNASSIYATGFPSTVKVGDIVSLFAINSTGTFRTYKDIVTAIGANYITLKNIVTRSNSTYYLVSQTTRTKSNTLLHCDIIGNPSNYPTSWKQSGVFGTPLIVAEDGTSLLPTGSKSTFKLSRKANATPLLCLRSTDSGATWTSFTPTFSTTTNEITLTNEPATNLVMIYYQTHTSMAVSVANSEVLEIGDCQLGGSYAYNAPLTQTLINKVIVAGGYASLINKLNTFTFSPTTSKIDGVIGVSHNTVVPYNTTAPLVKTFPYLTRTNGKAYLNLVFKEMKYNSTAGQWGDDTKFNIVDNVSTTTDFYGSTVLIGQKTVELPYFIEGAE